jgi:hypothetical protein
VGIFSLCAFAILGTILLVSPWTQVWEQAMHALAPEQMEVWMLSGWVRGGVSGLGALDLAIAVQLFVQLVRRGRSGA